MPIATPEERIGQRIADKYQLQAILGRGGMGVVYAAEHTWTARRVAVKLLLPEYSREERLAARFLQEARAAASLKHPSVVDVLDMGQDDQNTVYMVLELLEGETLRQLLERKGRLGARECLELLLPILDALGEAHAAGIVHRDIKPDNIFISRGPKGTTVPKLLDFGVARVVDSDGASDMATNTGQAIGTPWYMAPEQARGEREIGPATDLWAIAVVLYQCFSGLLPFRGEGVLSTLQLIARGTHTPLHQAAPDLAGALAREVERGLSVDPFLRHGSARELAAALTRAVEAEPEAATLPTCDPTLPSPSLPSRPSNVTDSGAERTSFEPARATTSGSSRPRRRWGAISAAFVATLALGLAAQHFMAGKPQTSPAPRSESVAAHGESAAPAKAVPPREAAPQASLPTRDAAVDGHDASSVKAPATQPSTKAGIAPRKRKVRRKPRVEAGPVAPQPTNAAPAAAAPAPKKRPLATQW